MNNTNFKYFLEDRYDIKNVVVDEWYLSGWVIQIIWRTEDIPLLDKRTSVTEVNIREYGEWKKCVLGERN